MFNVSKEEFQQQFQFYKHLAQRWIDLIEDLQKEVKTLDEQILNNKLGDDDNDVKIDLKMIMQLRRKRHELYYLLLSIQKVDMITYFLTNCDC